MNTIAQQYSVGSTTSRHDDSGDCCTLAVRGLHRRVLSLALVCLYSQELLGFPLIVPVFYFRRRGLFGYRVGTLLAGGSTGLRW